MKVAIIGAGNVGAMVASRIIDSGLADVALMDIIPGLAKGKAMDISDARPIVNSKVKIQGTEEFKDIKGSSIVVITAGLARKPCMSRDDLLKKNSEIIKNISLEIKAYCPGSIVIVVTNPLDVMSYLVMKTTGFSPNKVIGMAGVLDSARFINIVSDKINNLSKDKIFMMGSHGDSMVAIDRTGQLSESLFKESSERAKNRGAEIVAYLKTTSAYFAPSASVFHMIKSILKNSQETLCASVYLNGEYEEKGLYIGVPVKLDSSGVKEIIEIELSEQEKACFKEAVQWIQDSIKQLLPI